LYYLEFFPREADRNMWSRNALNRLSSMLRNIHFLAIRSLWMSWIGVERWTFLTMNSLFFLSLTFRILTNMSKSWILCWSRTALSKSNAIHPPPRSRRPIFTQFQVESIGFISILSITDSFLSIFSVSPFSL
jgi:hypothetical protein